MNQINIDPNEGIICADWVMKYVVDGGARILYSKYLEGKLPIYTSEDIINWGDGVLMQQFLVIDKGESKYQMLNKWNDEEEPKNKQLDNCATISVKMERQKNNMATDLGDTDDTKSMRSVKSGRSTMSAVSASQRLRIAANRANGANRLLSSMKKNNQPNEPLPLVQTEIPEDSYVWEFQEMPDDRPPPEHDPIADRLRDDRELKNKERIREQERMRKIREDLTAQQEKQKELVRQLKHKQYTWDYNGEIMLLKQGKQAEVTLHVNEILNIETKTKDPLVVVKENTTVPEVKPVKEGLGKNEERGKFERATAQEFPKQPPILESLMPKQGVNIVFDNGYIKEGGPLKHDKISKSFYSELIDNQPRPKHPYPFNRPDEIKEPEENKTDRQLDESEEKEQAPILKNISIENVEQYMQMLQNDTVRKSNSNSKTKPKLLSQSQMPLQKLKVPERYHKQKLERVNAYKKGQNLIKILEQLMQPLSPRSQPHQKKETKLHQVLSQFDQEIQESPSWGQVGVLKESKPTSTPYQSKHNPLQKSVPSLRTQAAFFPKIKSNNTILPSEMRPFSRAQRV